MIENLRMWCEFILDTTTICISCASALITVNEPLSAASLFGSDRVIGQIRAKLSQGDGSAVRTRDSSDRFISLFGASCLNYTVTKDRSLQLNTNTHPLLELKLICHRKRYFIPIQLTYPHDPCATDPDNCYLFLSLLSSYLRSNKAGTYIINQTYRISLFSLIYLCFMKLRYNIKKYACTLLVTIFFFWNETWDSIRSVYSRIFIYFYLFIVWLRDLY